MTLAWSALAHSEIGLVRKDNQDSGYVSDTMVMVADGMGGAAAGDLASAVVVTELARADTQPPTDPVTELETAVERANEVLAAVVEQDPSCDGMGTTLCGGILSGDDLTIVHIGDSRGYLYRAGRLRRLTHDHSYVQSLIDQGKLSEDEALDHPHRSLLLRVLNGQRYSAPEYFSQTLQAGDRLMFCSDGLCGLVTDSVIAGLIATADPTQALEQLIAAAHLASGSDNITIILADVRDAASPLDGATTPPTGVTSGQDQPPLKGFTDHGLLGAAADQVTLGRIPAPSRGKTGGADGRRGHRRAEVTRTRVTRTGATRTRRRRRVIGLTGLIVIALIGVGWGVYAYGASQYYVGAAGGYVAIYQGVAGDILGLPTSRVVETTPIALTTLPFSYRDRVGAGITIDSGGITQARATVAELNAKSQQCLAQRSANAGRPGSDGC